MHFHIKKARKILVHPTCLKAPKNVQYLPLGMNLTAKNMTESDFKDIQTQLFIFLNKIHLTLIMVI
jgi:hypothetical protein